MDQVLSIWRSPLDKVALQEAESLSARQPRCSINYQEDFSLMTIYNFGYYDYTYPTSNDDALTHMFTDMSSANPYGGMAFIPQKSYSVTATSAGFTVPYSSQFVASGGGGSAVGSSASPFFHFTIGGGGNPLYFLYSSGDHTSGGTYFIDLAFKWTGATTGFETCIYANTWNCRAIRCNFVNCPIVFNAQGLSCGMEHCTVQYDDGPNGGSTPQTSHAVIIFSGEQSYIIGPGEFQQTPVNAPGPTGITCVSIQDAEHFIITNTHLSDWSYGINYSIGNNPSTVAGDVSFVECESYITPVFMQCKNSAARIYAQKFTSCAFSLATNAGTPNITSSSLFVIDPNGFSNNNLEDIELNNCTIYQSNLHGLEIKGGQRLRVIGGQYSGNGPSGGAGIAITGSCGDVTISGADLGPKYYNQTIPQSQQWALLVTGSPGGSVLLDSCAMNGYAPASPVSVTGSPTQLVIKNCPGYNDLNSTILSGTTHLPTSSGVSAATAGSLSGGTNYYGPSLIIFTNGSSSITFTTNSVASTVPANAFVVYYVASPYDNIRFPAGTPAAFTWLGK